MEGEVTLENFTFSDDEWNCLYGHLLLQPTDRTELSSPHSRLLNYLWSKSDHFADGGVIGGEVDDIVATAERKRGSYSHTYGNVYTGGTSSSLKISPSLQREIDGESNNQSEALVGLASSAKPQGQNFCNRSWDGLLCWPETQEGDSVTLSCFKELRGIPYDETRMLNILLLNIYKSLFHYLYIPIPCTESMYYC
ncbi:unnamed protein product [Allacma fusca]|uniref:G-protein coupled receptors family 2 profile 1 domain-containing protein n=1 Tax=Allacma fusca TaxID=39272 RepID=A0A8J2K0R5_9HEXA|nr:unnamed protein product [Allacma fusca]